MSLVVQHPYTVDISNGTVGKTIQAPMVLGDANAHELVITILDKGTAADLSGYTAVLYAVRSADRVTVPNECTVVGNVVSASLSGNSLSVNGRVDLYLTLSKVDTGTITPVWVEANCAGGITTTVSDPDNLVIALPEMLALAAASAQATADAVAAAGSAEDAAAVANAATANALRTDIDQSLTLEQAYRAQNNLRVEKRQPMGTLYYNYNGVAGSEHGVLTGYKNNSIAKYYTEQEAGIAYNYFRCTLPITWSEMSLNKKSYTFKVRSSTGHTLAIVLSADTSWGVTPCASQSAVLIPGEIQEITFDFNTQSYIDYFDARPDDDINFLFVLKGYGSTNFGEGTHTVEVAMYCDDTESDEMYDFTPPFATSAERATNAEEATHALNADTALTALFASAKNLTVLEESNHSVTYYLVSGGALTNEITSFSNSAIRTIITPSSQCWAYLHGVKLGYYENLQGKQLFYKNTINNDRTGVTRFGIAIGNSWGPTSKYFSISISSGIWVTIDLYDLLTAHGYVAGDMVSIFHAISTENVSVAIGNINVDWTTQVYLMDSTETGFVLANAVSGLETLIDTYLTSQSIGSNWKDKAWCSYGDSITAIGNGSAYSDLTAGWQGYVNSRLSFAYHYGRGIGGQRFAWGTNGGSVVFINADGTINSRNDSYNYDNYEGNVEVPEGCSAIRGCYASWLRIISTIPLDTDMIFLMGSTNDSYSATDAAFIAEDDTDPEWAASDKYAEYGGDYNITTLKGGIASCIMKMQAWVPGAIIVLATPLSGRGVTGENNTTLEVDETEKAEVVREMANLMSIPLVDVFHNTGINSLNRATYITDTVHPYGTDGKKALARAVIGGLMVILPNI